MLAVRAGKVQTVRTLLEHGADAAAANKLGCTPSHLAAINGKIDICRYLMQLFSIKVGQHTVANIIALAG